MSLDFRTDWRNQVICDIFHLFKCILELALRNVQLLQILFKALETHFVVILKLSKWRVFALHSIIGQMNHFVLNVVQIIFFRRRSNIAVPVPISFEHAIYSRYQYVAPKVKFPIVDSLCKRIITENIFRCIFGQWRSFCLFFGLDYPCFTLSVTAFWSISLQFIIFICVLKYQILY